MVGVLKWLLCLFLAVLVLICSGVVLYFAGYILYGVVSAFLWLFSAVEEAFGIKNAGLVMLQTAAIIAFLAVCVHDELFGSEILFKGGTDG